MMDAIGNNLHKGDLVYMKPDGKNFVGEIVEIHDGGMVLRDQKVSPASVEIVFRFTIVALPNQPFRELIAVKQPERDETPKIATRPS